MLLILAGENYLACKPAYIYLHIFTHAYIYHSHTDNDEKCALSTKISSNCVAKASCTLFADRLSNDPNKQLVFHRKIDAADERIVVDE